MTRASESMALFLGVLAAGLPVLLPAIYLLLHSGWRHAASFYGVVLAAILVSDVGWYLVGRCGAFARLRARVLSRRTAEHAGAFARGVLPSRGPLLFACRFVYGTKIAMQVLSGFTRFRFPAYVGISLASSVLWLGLLTGLGLLCGSALHRLDLGVRGTHVALAGLAAMGLMLNVGSRRVARGAWPGKPRAAARQRNENRRGSLSDT